MYPFKQNEVKAEVVLQMSVARCDECPGSTDCKRYMQWLRLNSTKRENAESYLDFEEMPPVDRPYYRRRSEEMFW